MKSMFCSVEGCSRRVFVNGMCKGHDQRVARTGSPGSPHFRPYSSTPRPCSQRGCDEVARVNGLCHAHDERQRNGRDMSAPMHHYSKAPSPPCAVEGCNSLAKTRGWCSRHYKRWWDYGDPGPATFAERNQHDKCSVDSCPRAHQTGGYCDLHYRRLRRGVDPASVAFIAVPKPRLPNTYRAIHRQLSRERGNANTHVCTCGTPADQWAYQHNDPHVQYDEAGLPYSLNLMNYVAMCRTCHVRLDKDLNERARRQPKGVEFSCSTKPVSLLAWGF